MNWTNILKKGIITIIILALGLVMFFACGFNKGYDFTGGSNVTVNITPYVESTEGATDASATNKIKNVIAQYNNVSIYSVSSGENSSGDKTIIIKYQITKDVANTNTNILNDLFTDFGYDKDGVVESTYVNMVTEIQPAYGNGVFIYALLGALAATIACAIYVWLRHGFASAITLIIGVAIDTLMLLALTLILRLQITAHIGYAILSIALISLIFNTFALSKLRENSFAENLNKTSNKDIADITRKSLLKPYILILGIILVALLIVSIISYGNAGGSIYAVAISLLSVFVTSLFIVPNLWSLIYIRKEKAPKKIETVEVEHE